MICKGISNIWWKVTKCGIPEEDQEVQWQKHFDKNNRPTKWYLLLVWCLRFVISLVTGNMFLSLRAMSSNQKLM